jgi:hypothetical protein
VQCRNFLVSCFSRITYVSDIFRGRFMYIDREIPYVYTSLRLSDKLMYEFSFIPDRAEYEHHIPKPKPQRKAFWFQI